MARHLFCDSPWARNIFAEAYTPQLETEAWQVQPSSVQNPTWNEYLVWLPLPCTPEPGAEFLCWHRVPLYQWSIPHTAPHKTNHNQLILMNVRPLISTLTLKWSIISQHIILCKYKLDIIYLMTAVTVDDKNMRSY